MNSATLLKPLRRLFGGSKAQLPLNPPRFPAAPAEGAPLAVQHAWSPEPNALKLQINRLLLPLGDKRKYAAAAQAAESPLAQAIFALGGLESVEIDGAFVTSMMAADADWDALMKRVPETIRAHLEAGKPAVQLSAVGSAPAKKYSFGFRHIERTPEEQFEIVQKLFADEVNPAVAQHGGHFTLLEVKENRVFVELGGGCQGCGMADVTLRQGVEQRLREVMPEMVALIDITDHASGTNPYYQPSK